MIYRIFLLTNYINCFLMVFYLFIIGMFTYFLLLFLDVFFYHTFCFRIYKNLQNLITCHKSIGMLLLEVAQLLSLLKMSSFRFLWLWFPMHLNSHLSNSVFFSLCRYIGVGGSLMFTFQYNSLCFWDEKVQFSLSSSVLSWQLGICFEPYMTLCPLISTWGKNRNLTGIR